MKKFIPILFLVPFLTAAFSCNSHDTIINPGPNKNLTSIDKDVASSSVAFGINLLKDIDKTQADSNIFISPLSVSTALGMTLNGANGETYTQMKNTLQLPGDTQDDVNQAYLDLNTILKTSDSMVTFTSANSIWCRQGLSFEQNFLNVNKNYFNALVQTLDFTNPASVGTINNWVSENTNGKITNIITAIPSDEVMYLINAIYFKASWEYIFDSLNTKSAPFNSPAGTVFCSMMKQTNNFNYYASSNFSALEIPYSNGNFNMLIILPNNNVDVNQLLGQVNVTVLNQINTGRTLQQVTLYLPRFQLNYKIELNKFLTDLGMVDAFESLADFSKISNTIKLLITDVIHKTYVKVGEEGTEAAAVTAVGIGATVVIPDPGIIFRVDRPFIFLITEKNSGAVLFEGKIVNPLE